MHYTCRMKSASIPQIRIEPTLRAELEAVLSEGETLSAFVESSVRRAIEYRRVQVDFHARGEAAWNEFQRTGESFSTEEVLATLRQTTAKRRAELESRRG